ncbi:MAG: hypothetical protein ACFFG0_01290 [Candidatus Thorarchaeota archaeon]
MNQINNYLDKLQEQFDGHIAATDIRGDFNNDWTNCYETRCYRQFENKYERDICKTNCVISAANQAIARLNAAKGKCTTSENPNRCVKSLESAVKSFQNKLNKAREAQTAINARLAAFRAKTAGV